MRKNRSILILAAAVMAVLLCACSAAESAKPVELSFSQKVEAAITSGNARGDKLVLYTPGAEELYTADALLGSWAAGEPEEVGGIAAIEESEAESTVTITLPNGTVAAKRTFDAASRKEIGQWISDSWEASAFARGIEAELAAGASFGEGKGFLVKSNFDSDELRWDNTVVLPEEYRADSVAEALGYIELRFFSRTFNRAYDGAEVTSLYVETNVYFGDTLMANECILSRRTSDTVTEMKENAGEWLAKMLPRLEEEYELNREYQKADPASAAPSAMGVIAYDEDRGIYTDRFMTSRMSASGPEWTGFVLSYSISQPAGEDEQMTYTLKSYDDGSVLLSGTVSARNVVKTVYKYDAANDEICHGFANNAADGAGAATEACESAMIEKTLDLISSGELEAGSKLVAYDARKEQYATLYSFGLDAGETPFFSWSFTQNIGGYVICESSFPKTVSRQYRDTRDNKTVMVPFYLESLKVTLIDARSGKQIAQKTFTVGNNFKAPSYFTLNGLDPTRGWNIYAGDCFNVTGWIDQNWNAFLKRR